MRQNRAIFLDRDGTVIKHVHYLTDPAQVELAPGCVEALQLLYAHGFYLVVVSNQSVIGRGTGTEAQVNACNKRMVNLLAEHEIKLDGLYYCPHVPEDYCKCRKPKTGMLQMAAGELRLDLPTSVMIGDNITDVEAGHNAGCALSILLGDAPEGVTCMTAENLPEAAELVLKLSILGGTPKKHDL